MQLHKLASRYINLHAVTKACIQLQKLAYSYKSLHEVTYACIQLQKLAWWVSQGYPMIPKAFIQLHELACSYIQGQTKNMAGFVLWFQRLLEVPKFDLRIKVG